MRLDEQYSNIKELCTEIDKRLVNSEFDSIKEMILYLNQQESYNKLKLKDNRLIALDRFIGIWLEEKKILTDAGIVDDIFGDVSSLVTLEKKYNKIRFGLLRMETEMPEEYYEQAIDFFVENKVSGIALCKIIIIDTVKRKEIMLNVSRRYKNRGRLLDAVFLLQEAEKYYPNDCDILMELADCWMEGSQFEMALEVLKKIHDNDEVTNIINELESVLKPNGL